MTEQQAFEMQQSDANYNGQLIALALPALENALLTSQNLDRDSLSIVLSQDILVYITNSAFVDVNVMTYFTKNFERTNDNFM